MDIKNLSESVAVSTTPPQARDLLAQLKAAGSVEAEVVKVLQDKLLLSTRLGDFLTSNTLNYRPGDKFDLRLGGSEQNPVLKSRALTPEPATLDSVRNRRLQRVLASNQPTLAVVTQVSAQRMEIRLAEQILTLPRQPGVVRDQLLSLRRNDSNRSIEITPLERKQIYKALLKQLVPRQPDSSSGNLVRLLNLVSKAIAEPGSQPLQAQNISRQTVPANGSQAPTLVAPKSQSAPKPAIASQAVAATSSGRPATSQAAVPSSSTGPAATLQPPEAAPTGRNRQIGALLQQVKRADTIRPDHNPAASRVANKPAAPRAPTPTNPGPESRTEISVPIKTAPPGTGKAVGNANIIAAGTGRPTWLPETLAGNSLPAGSRPVLPAQQPPVVSQPAADAAKPANSAAPTDKSPTTLQRLLQLVPRINQMSVAQIKQWLEFAGLVRGAAPKPAPAQAFNPLQALKQLASQEALSREIIQSIQPKANPRAGDEPPPTKTMPPELLQQYARDGIKLIEQSLSQNLLQRASLGMQQETQQPLSLGFALPFLDEHRVKPLQIDLAQREQAREHGERGWDVRLNFDFAGLGPVAVHLFLDGIAVAASFYAEQAVTRNRIEQALPELKQQLSSAGFVADELHSFSGVSDKAASAAAGLSESLIDIEV